MLPGPVLRVHDDGVQEVLGPFLHQDAAYADGIPARLGASATKITVKEGVNSYMLSVANLLHVNIKATLRYQGCM